MTHDDNEEQFDLADKCMAVFLDRVKWQRERFLAEKEAKQRKRGAQETIPPAEMQRRGLLSKRKPIGRPWSGIKAYPLADGADVLLPTLSGSEIAFKRNRKTVVLVSRPPLPRKSTPYELYRQRFELFPSVRKRWKSLPPEKRECNAFAEYLTIMEAQERLAGIWFHVCNEISSNRNPVYGQQLKEMGKMNGVPDYCFMSNGPVGSFFIEMKIIDSHGKKTYLNRDQKIFHGWSHFCGVPVYVVYSSDQAIEILKEKKFILPPTERFSQSTLTPERE